MSTPLLLYREQFPAESKVWGRVRHVFASPDCAVSILEVKRGYACSRHLHRARVNRFIVHSGALDVVQYADSTGEREMRRDRLRAGDALDVPAGVVHRFEVLESGVVVEVYYPAHTVRLEDIERLDQGGAL